MESIGIEQLWARLCGRCFSKETPHDETTAAGTCVIMLYHICPVTVLEPERKVTHVHISTHTIRSENIFIIYTVMCYGTIENLQIKAIASTESGMNILSTE